MTLEVFNCICAIIILYFIQLATGEKKTRFEKIVNFVANIVITLTLGYLLGVALVKFWFV